MRKLKQVISSILLIIAPFSASQADEQLHNYTKSAGVAGSILSVGSDTLAGMMSLWVEEFQALYPNVDAQVQASGSATAPPALTDYALVPEWQAHILPLS